MKYIQTFESFLNESEFRNLTREEIGKVLKESTVAEATITSMQMDMKGKDLVNRITIGSKFLGELTQMGKNKTERVTLTVTGYGDRANAFRIFEVENEKGEKSFLKVTVMYGVSYRVSDNPRADWDQADRFTLEKIEKVI